MTVRTYAQQKAALTRALKRKSFEHVLSECRRTVAEWESPEWAAAHNVRQGAWPDDWARWQRALDDASDSVVGPRLEEI